jgi:hypothetical protein
MGKQKFSLPDEKCNSNVASAISGKKPHILTLENYSEDKLIKLVKEKKYKKLYIDYRFWNYKYCGKENLKVENLFHLYPLKKELVDPDLFYVGMIVVFIMYYKTLYLTLEIDNQELFEKYLSSINIDRDDFAKFLTEKRIYFPLTRNYLAFIKRIFKDETIGEYLFAGVGEIFYDLEDTKLILENFNIYDIRNYAELIIDSPKFKIDDKLRYFSLVLDFYDESIDWYETVYFTKKEKQKPVGYYLHNMKIDDQNYNLYQSVMDKYFLLDGAVVLEEV